MFKRRIGLDPHSPDSEGAPTSTPAADGCPDIWELENGDFAVIGFARTADLRPKLPQSASCGPDEGIVVIPRALLMHAKDYIPDA